LQSEERRLPPLLLSGPEYRQEYQVLCFSFEESTSLSVVLFLISKKGTSPFHKERRNHRSSFFSHVDKKLRRTLLLPGSFPFSPWRRRRVRRLSFKPFRGSSFKAVFSPASIKELWGGTASSPLPWGRFLSSFGDRPRASLLFLLPGRTVCPFFPPTSFSPRIVRQGHLPPPPFFPPLSARHWDVPALSFFPSLLFSTVPLFLSPLSV